MSLDPEKMKTLIAFKKRLENQLEALNVENREVQTALDIVNTMLLEKGFKRGDLKEAQLQLNLPKEIELPKQETPEITPQPVTITTTSIPSPTLTVTTTASTTLATSTTSASLLSHDRDEVFSLKTMNDESLALICFNKEVIHVMPDESKQFNVKTPPFQNFLVERVFDKMKEKDIELVRANQLEASKAFTYEIIKEEDLLREIVIHNVDDERLKELKSSIRWTLEKMYEKMQN